MRYGKHPARPRWTSLAFAITVVAATSFSGTAEAQSVGGWRWAGIDYPSAAEACRAQWEWAGMNNGYSRLMAPTNYKDSAWSTQACHWTSFQYLAPQETGCGVFSCGTVLPSLVFFNCPSGYTRQYPGRCVAEEDLRPERQPCLGPDGAPNPIAGNPIVLSTGAKLLKSTDFTTSDGRFVIGRNYRSIPFGRSNNVRSLALGLVGGWQFDFGLEVHLGTFSGSPSSPTGNVTVLAPDGTSYDFVLQSSGDWVPRAATGLVTHAYRLEFVGTLPTTLSSIPSNQSIWRVTGPDNRTWTVRTFAHVNEPTRFLTGRPTEFEDLDGYGWEFTYDSADGRLEEITDTYGRTAVFTWNDHYVTALPNVSGSLPFPSTIAMIELPDGSKLFYSYDPPPAAAAPSGAISERLVGVDWLDDADDTIDSVTYHYEDPDHSFAITGITDHRNIRVATYAYDDRGRAISTQGADGADLTTVAYSLDGNDSIRTVTNALGKETVYRFSAISGSKSNVRLTDVDGTPSANCPASSRSYTYATNGFVDSETDNEGRVTEYERNSRGRPTLIRQAAGTAAEREILLTWDPDQDIVLQRAVPGLTTTYAYDANGRLVSQTETDTTTHSLPYPTNGQTRTWTWTYSTEGRLLTADGPLAGASDRVSYTWDVDGNLATVTDELGHVTTVLASNDRGFPIEVQDPNGRVSEFHYDARGRLVATVDEPAGINAQTSYEYDAAGNVTKVTSPNGAFLEYGYDNASRVTAITDNLGQSINYTYDALGNVTSQINRDAGNTPYFQVAQAFDELGRLMTITRAWSAQWDLSYDKVDNLVSVTDPNSRTTIASYDALDRLVAFTDERSATRSYAYAHGDEPALETDPRAIGTTYVRNGWGEVIEEASPDIGALTYVRDSRGLVTSRTDGRGVVTNYTYDGAGRLLSASYPSEPAINVAYSYDSIAGGNAGRGQLTSVTDAAGSASYHYDVLGNLVTESRAIDSSTYDVSYAYDEDGQVTEITYPSGRIVGFNRNANGHVSAVWMRADSFSPVESLAWWTERTPFGERRGIGHANGLTDFRTFNADGDVQSILLHDGPLEISDKSFIHQDDRNLTLIVDELDASRSEQYWYAANGFLQNADGPWGELTYWIDDAGNITHKIHGQGSTSTTDAYGIPGGSNRLVSVTTDGIPARSFTSDAAGNITSDVGTTAKAFTWNADGQLAEATVGAALVGSYRYDHMRRLVSKLPTLPSPAIHYIHDQFNNVIAEYDSTGVLYREYIWLEERPLAVVMHSGAGSSIYHVHTDHLHRPVRMTDASKATVWEATYLPFGEVYSVSGPLAQNYRFPGQWFQVETGLHYNWNRHFDPSTGRYLQPDPLGTVDGHRWAYAMNSPLMNVDFEGLFVAPLVRRGIGYGLGRLLGPSPRPIPPLPLPPGPGPSPALPDDPPQYCPAPFGAEPPDDEEEDDDPCEKQYQTETQQCNAITARRGRAAGARCHATAAARYAACRAGKPLPPFDTWNN